MNFIGRKVLIDPVGTRTKSDGGILYPDFMHHPNKIGQIKSPGGLGKSMGLEEGDIVLYYMEHTSDIDGVNKFAAHFDGKMYLAMSPYVISGKFDKRFKKHLDQMKKTGIASLGIDYSKDITPIAGKVFVKLKKKETLTESGIKLPDFKLGQDYMYGEIVAAGPEANRNNYDKKELQVGDIVCIGSTASGGLMGQDLDGSDVWKTNGDEVKMKMKGDDWVPVGPRLIVEPYMNGMKKSIREDKHPFLDKMIKTEVWEDPNNPDVFMPATSNVKNLTSKVISVGSGYDPESMIGKNHSMGKMEVKPGDLIYHLQLYKLNDSKPSTGVIKLEGEEERYLIPYNYVDATFKADTTVQHLPVEGQLPPLLKSHFGL